MENKYVDFFYGIPMSELPQVKLTEDDYDDLKFNGYLIRTEGGEVNTYFIIDTDEESYFGVHVTGGDSFNKYVLIGALSDLPTFVDFHNAIEKILKVNTNATPLVRPYVYQYIR